jgi:hypothetical protein
MHLSVSHDRSEETPEAKTRWFRSLSIEDRMNLFCALTDLALSTRPELAEPTHAESTSNRVRVLSKEPG